MNRSLIQPRRARARRGSTMVVVALLLAAVAMLSFSFLMVLRSSQKENQGSRESLSALYAAEAGLTAGVDRLAQGDEPPFQLGSKAQPVDFGGQEYWVDAQETDERIRITSYGQADRARMGVEMWLQPSASGFFRWAAFGDEWVHLNSNSRTDSYDSEAGTYALQTSGSGNDLHANEEGDVGSNANITMNSNIKIWGDASPGPSGTVSGSKLMNITGSTTPMATTISLPDVVVPSIALSGVFSGNSQALAKGLYHYANLQLNSNQTLTINGPATIVCDNFKLKSNSKVVVNATEGPVQFYVVDDFVLNQNTSIYSTTYDPQDVTFKLLSDNVLDPGIDVDFDSDLIGFDSNSKLYGTMYAPEAAITINSNFELFGALVARRVDLNSNCRLHYDERLMTAGGAAEAAYDTLSWRVISQP